MDPFFSQEKYRVISTNDGSKSLLHLGLQSTFHSTHGALQESKQVFIQQGLMYASLRFGEGMRVAEIGFGTGLNALLTMHWSAENKIPVQYHAFEKFPLAPYWIEQLNYSQHFPPSFSEAIKEVYSCEWEKMHRIHPFFSLCKYQADILHCDVPQSLQLIYYDAVAPAHSPEMWEMALFQQLFHALDKGGVLVTFCAKGSVKRLLKQIGFEVQTLPGPPGKREMTRAIKPT